MIEFPISGVVTYWWLPLVVAFAVSAVTSTAGLSGAFLLLPFQVSVLGFTSPAVTPTNLLFNVIAIPSGVYRYYREKRMVWPLVATITLGTIPGLVLGVVARVKFLPDARSFKLFVGLVLLYIAIRLALDVLKGKEKSGSPSQARRDFTITPVKYTPLTTEFLFEGQPYRISTVALFVLAAVVGLIGGIYGIGGGAIIAPFLVTVFRLPVYAVAGAALCGTMVSSIVGVLLYLLMAPFFGSEIPLVPDWHLGLMFGLGGAIGMYLGARAQKYLPARLIKSVLGLIMFYISIRYVIGYFL